MAVRMMIANAECLLHDKLLSVGNVDTLGERCGICCVAYNDAVDVIDRRIALCFTLGHAGELFDARSGFLNL